MKRFYKAAGITAAGNGWQVALDGKPVKTPGKLPQIVPARALAEAMTAEWDEQGDEIDPARFVFRDLADFAIDAIAPDRQASIDALLPYGETDTLCYRAEPGEPLRAEQDALWEPVLHAAEARWDIHFVRVAGVLHQPQPPATLARLVAVLAALDPFQLAALRNTVSLAASLVTGLLALEPGADADMLWEAACLEEDWQARQWGRDAEAEARRALRRKAFLDAVRFAELARG